MTNGEKIQQDFECKVCEPIIEDDIIHVIFTDKPDSAIGFDLSWWNMEYKESTTKNCESCKYYSSHHEVCNYCYECSLWTEKESMTKNDCAEQNGCISCSLDDGDDCCRKLYEESMQEPKWLKSELIKLIDKTYEDFNNAPGGETWCEIDGNEYYSDMGYAFEGINMFVDVLKSRMEDT